MAATVTPAKNPFYNPDSGFSPDVQVVFNSRIFHIDKNDTTGDNLEYTALMNEILDNASKYYMFKEPSKSWTKEGRLLIHVEYYEAQEIERGLEDLEY